MTKEWYIRIRGRVTGPFTLDELREFARRDQLQPFYEVSRDQVAWQSAASLLEVAAPAETPPPVPQGDPSSPPPPPHRPPRLPRKRPPSLDLRTAFTVALVGCLASALLGGMFAWGFTALGKRQVNQVLRDRDAQTELVVKQLDKAKEHINELAHKVTAGEKDNDGLRKQLDKLQGQLKDQERDLTQANQKLAQARTDEADRLKGEMDQLRKDNADLQGKLDAAQVALERARQAARPSNQRGAEADARKEVALAAKLELARKTLGGLRQRGLRWQGLADGRNSMTPEDYFKAFPARRDEFRQDLAGADRDLPQVTRELEQVRAETSSAGRMDEAAAALDRAREVGDIWKDVRKRLGLFAAPPPRP